MKLLLILTMCAAAAAAPGVEQVELFQLDTLVNAALDTDILVDVFISYLRFIIKNGDLDLGIPPLDPLELDHYHLVFPAGILNLDLDLENIRMDDLNAFEVHSSILNLSDMTFDIDISLPTLDIRADNYVLNGDFLTAFPLYGQGEARFVVQDFRFQARLYLKQSDDGTSVLIARVENPSFVIPGLKSELTGVIGGGDIDAIVNAMIEDVIIDYVNRFQGAISLIAGSVLVTILNPFLDQLDTWKYIVPFMPTN